MAEKTPMQILPVEVEGMEETEAQGRKNFGVFSTLSGKLKVLDVGYPVFKNPVDKSEIRNGVILKVIVSAICGSDRHTVHGRTPDVDLVLGHEITGEVVEKGPGVQFLKLGDIVSVPFNISCGHCVMCRKRQTSLCLNTNTLPTGGIYGYPMSGGWCGGQAQYVMVPFADFNLIKFPDHFKDKIWDKMLDLALLTDVLPTAFRAACKAGVGLGKSVFIAGAGPIGLACAQISHLMGASEIFISEVNRKRLDHAQRHLKCHTFDGFNHDQSAAPEFIKKVLGCEFVDCGVDCVGFEAKKLGTGGKEENPSEVLNFLVRVVRQGGKIAVPGVYLAPDPKGVDENAKNGFYTLGFSEAWIKGIEIVGMGQTNVAEYHWELMQAIFHERLSVAKLLNVKVISLDEVPIAFEDFDKGTPVKYLIDPHGWLRLNAPLK